MNLESITAEVRRCELCRLCETRHNAVPGEGPVEAKIVFVGEAPGAVNDEVGRPFVGHGGKIFDRILGDAGLDRSKVFVTNAVKCWPPGNRRPSKRELEACSPFLAREIDQIQPVLIVALGSVAFEVLMSQTIRIKDDHGKLYYRGTVPVCPTFHPNGIRYVKGGLATIVSDLKSALSAIPFAHSTSMSDQMSDQSKQLRLL